MGHVTTMRAAIMPVIRNPSDRAALKTLTRELVARLGGGDAAAATTRVQKSNLSDYGSPHHPDRFAPIDVILDLEAALGEPLVTAALARAAGWRLAAGAVECAARPGQALAKLGREMGDVFAATALAQADGAIDAREAAGLVKELDDMIAAAEAARAALRGVK